MKLKAFVNIQSDEVKWLIIESDDKDTKGYFLYYHLDDNNAYDTWHKTIEDAFDAAKQQYGTSKESWKEVE
jgi:hypothetical protein